MNQNNPTITKDKNDSWKWNKTNHFYDSFSVFKKRFKQLKEDDPTTDKLLTNYECKRDLNKLIEQKNSSLDYISQILERAPRAILIADNKNKLVFINQAAESLLGYTKEELSGLALHKVYCETPPEVNGRKKEIEAKVKSKTGEVIPVLVATNSRNEGESKLVIYFLTDISRQKEKEVALRTKIDSMRETSENLKKLVKTDPLTGLLNRRGLESILIREVELAKRNNSNLVAALIDLDDFKSINNNYGHAGGDLVLKSVSKILKKCLRSSDWIGRVGGDEFMVFLPSTSYSEAVSIGERMREEVACTEVKKDGKAIRVTTSTGLNQLNAETSNLQDVMETTRQSLEASKASGKNLVSVTTSGKTKSFGRNPLTDMLVDSSGYSVVPQPIYNLTTNKIRAVELFSRGPSTELSAPEVFFQIAKETQLLSEVDLNCFKNCMDYATEMENDYIVHVNIFPSTIYKTPVNRLIDLKNKTIPKKTLCIELSSKYMPRDPSILVKKLTDLKSQDIIICIDDIGYGSSSIEALTLLAPHCIKLDRAMVSDLVVNANKITSADKLLKIARLLNCLVIAEGVETLEELKALKRLDILYAQGWYWRDELSCENNSLIEGYYSKNKLDDLSILSKS